jgi:hypothetical protein
MWKNIRSPSTEPHADVKAYIQWGAAWFSKWIVKDTAVSTPVPCSPRHDTFHHGLGNPEPRLPACVVATPKRVISSTPVTASHVTQGRVEYESTTPRGTDKGFDLWVAVCIVTAMDRATGQSRL